MRRPFIIIYVAAALAIIMNAGCATLPKDFDRPESYALADTENTLFGKLLADEKADHPGKSPEMARGFGAPTPRVRRAAR